MSVVFVVLGFVLICLILVHLNLHQKKTQLFNFMKKVYKSLIVRHKKIKKLIRLIRENEEVSAIKRLNEETLTLLEKGEILPSERMRAEILIEDKMKTLIEKLEKQELSTSIKNAIESYKKTQKRIDKNKHTYNEIIKEFIEACNIKPAEWYIAFEKIDTDYPRLISE